MNDKFDELTKGLAQSVTRRQALRRFGIGLAGIVLATAGLAGKAKAATPSTACLPSGSKCNANADCCSGFCVHYPAGRGRGGHSSSVHVCA